MPQYLIAGYIPRDYDPTLESEDTIEAIHALNREMIAAGVRKLACGLSPRATTLRPQSTGELRITDGPFAETKEFIGGLWIVETANLEEALGWAEKGARACRTAMEVREIFFSPAAANQVAALEQAG